MYNGRVPLDSLLASWRIDPETAPNISAWKTLPAKPADFHPYPIDLPDALAGMLRTMGIHALFSHQAETWSAARRGENVIVSTGTASGKTLAFNLPVIASILDRPSSRALYIYPTKALAQDQSSILARYGETLQQVMNTDVNPLRVGIYDGDTPTRDRKQIRERASILLTNPDMLHTGILPHHTNWSEFFGHLQTIVIDEMHTYRGVFGSHFANVIRRLKRICAFYGSHPQFILASATIGNPRELAARLIEAPVRLVAEDGSARGPRHFILFNPPVLDASMGLRKSSVLESVRLSQQMAAEDLQQVVFTRTRRGVEMLLRYLKELQADSSEAGLRGYRSGYLPSQRRGIEQGLRDGSIRTVVATNALELGIDIGGMEASLLVGYPGTIASTRQQAGRAGRGQDPALAVLVATASPVDQYLSHHAEYFFGRTPEQALVDPDHLILLLNHLRCAMFELPFQKGDSFGLLSAERVEEFLQVMGSGGEVHASGDKYFWMADSYPAAGISLRSASPGAVILQAGDEQGVHTIGTVDAESALWMAHPGAVYMHEAHAFRVESLDMEHKFAQLTPFDGDYFTEPLNKASVQILQVRQQDLLPANSSAGNSTHAKSWGEIQVTTQVIGFRKLRWYSRENLGETPLDLPPMDLLTTGYWLAISDETVNRLGNQGLWSLPNDYGTDWDEVRLLVRQRDGFTCQVCGRAEFEGKEHAVHHKIPFRKFMHERGTATLETTRRQANDPANLVTLCADCHQKVESNVRIRSGLTGLGYSLGNLAPLFLMCDPADLGTHIEPVRSTAFPQPSVVLYDLIPGGIGFSERLYEIHADLLRETLDLVVKCPCEGGCPSCVGPGGENGIGGKVETLAILKELLGEPDPESANLR